MVTDWYLTFMVFVDGLWRTVLHVHACIVLFPHMQAHVFKLFEFVMLELNYVATAELTSIGLLLTQRE